VVNDAVAIQNAIKSTRHLKLRRIYYSASKLALPVDNVGYVVEGINTRFTGIRSGAPDYALEAIGANASSPAGDTYIFRNVLFYSTNSESKGIKLQSLAKVVVEDCKFSGFNGGEQLVLNQIFDSWFNRTYWTSHAPNGNFPTVLIDSGSVDNSNNLRFDGCAWESTNYEDVRIVQSTGAIANYMIMFDKCKFESQPSNAKVNLESGIVLSLIFDTCIFGDNSTVNPVIKMGTSAAARDLRVSKSRVVYKTNTLIPVFFALDNAVNSSFVDLALITGAGGVASAATVTANTVNHYSIGISLNTTAHTSFFNTSATSAVIVNSPVRLAAKNGNATLEQYRYDSANTLVGRSKQVINASGGLEFYIDEVLQFTVQKNLPQFSMLGTRYGTATAAATPVNTVFIDSSDGKLKFKDAGGTVNLLY